MLKSGDKVIISGIAHVKQTCCNREDTEPFRITSILPPDAFLTDGTIDDLFVPDELYDLYACCWKPDIDIENMKIESCSK